MDVVVTFSVEAGQEYKFCAISWPRGGRQLRRRSIHQSRPVRVQRMLQLLEVSPRSVWTTDCLSRVEVPGVASRSYRDNVARLRHIECALVPQRYTTPSLPRSLEPLHRMMEAKTHRSLNALPWHPCVESAWGYQDDTVNDESRLRIFGAYWGHKTSDVCDVRWRVYMGGGLLRGEQEKEWLGRRVDGFIFSSIQASQEADGWHKTVRQGEAGGHSSRRAG